MGSGWLGIAAMLCLTLIGCGGGGSDTKSSDGVAIGQGSKTVTCHDAIFGGGGSGTDWRRLLTSVGRFGVFGTGRDFRDAAREGFPPALRKRHVPGPILQTKTPFVVEGTRPVDVAIAPADRSRAGLLMVPFAGPGAGSYAEVRFVPCSDQPRTWWAGGWALRDHGQVTISVRDDGGPEQQLVVGRPN